MNSLNAFLDWVRDQVRRLMRAIAVWLNRQSNGGLSPNTVTIIGLLTHIPIAWLIAMQQNVLAGILLIIFGLFDALDGQLARVQNRASNAGMLLDASTDRMKEVLLYIGAAYNIASVDNPRMAAWAVAACGASICVSYVKAKGETAVAGGKLTASEVNQIFKDGLFRFEVRMTLLVIGLLLNQLTIIVVIIALTSAITAFDRLIKISRKIR